MPFKGRANTSPFPINSLHLLTSLQPAHFPILTPAAIPEEPTVQEPITKVGANFNFPSNMTFVSVSGGVLLHRWIIDIRSLEREILSVVQTASNSAVKRSEFGRRSAFIEVDMEANCDVRSDRGDTQVYLVCCHF